MYDYCVQKALCPLSYFPTLLLFRRIIWMNEKKVVTLYTSNSNERDNGTTE